MADTDNLEELARRLDDHPNCHSLGVAPEKLRSLIATAREVEGLRAEVARLREHIARQANTINVAGSPYHKVQTALDELVSAAKREALAALKNKGCEPMTDQNTRPQPSAEPVAVWDEAYSAWSGAWPQRDPVGADQAAAVIASALEAARREALEQAAKVLDQRSISQRAMGRPEDWPEDAWNSRQVGIVNALELAAETIRALKENPNAG